MKLLRGKTPYVIALSFGLIMAVLFFSARYTDGLTPIRNLVFDSYQRIKPRTNTDSAVVIIDVDEASIDELGQWPWPRTMMADLTDKLSKSGTIAIAYDMVFSEPDRTNPIRLAEQIPADFENRDFVSTVLSTLPDPDKAFSDAISKTPVVLGFFDLDEDNDEYLRKIAGVSWLGEDLSDALVSVDGSVSSMALFQDAASGHGSISVGTKQEDDIVRRIGMFNQVNGAVFPSLSIEALRIAIQNATGEKQSFIIKTSLSGTEGQTGRAVTAAKVANFEFPLTKDGALNIYYAPNSQSAYVSAKDVISGDTGQLEMALAGKIALVGTSAPGLRDIRTTTLREAVPGVAVHAQVIDQIMQGAFLHRPDWAPGAEAVLAILLTLMIVLVLPYAGVTGSAVFGAFCAAVTVATSWYAFDWYGLLLDPAIPLITALAAFIMTTLLLFAFAEREKRFVRSAFQHYLAPDLLTKLEDDPAALKLGGEIRDMTLMFLDVRNFTPISEKLDPQELVTFLNDLLSPLSDIIQVHEGAIDKYIGDSIMAFWNAPLEVSAHPEKACRAALAMMAKVDEMNARNAFGFEERGLEKVGIGIGINTGDGCVGNMGSATRFDYSVVGDTVNVAARLESASKDAKWPILVSRSTAEQAADLAFLPAGKLALKGKSEPQEVFALIGDETEAASEQFSKIRELYISMGNKRGKARKTDLDKLLAIAPSELHAFLSN